MFALTGCLVGACPSPSTRPGAAPATGQDVAPAAPTRTPGVTATQDVTRRLEGTELQVREVVLNRGGVPMSVWIYRRAELPPGTLLPVIVIAAAGSPLIWGMDLGEGDSPEHLPWAHGGYVVVAYSLDGPVADQNNSAQVEAGIRAFVASHAGLDNARAALDFALAHESGADATRVYAVGHSSAATLALRFGAEDTRVKGVVAFAPVPKVEERLGADVMAEIARVTPNTRTEIIASSPMSHLDALRTKPVYLFHASDDSNVPVADSQQFMAALQPAFAGSHHEIVESGGHYNAMMSEGIPRAMKWLDALSPPTR